MISCRDFPNRFGILLLTKNLLTKRCFASKTVGDDMEKGLAVSKSNQKRVSRPEMQPADEKYLIQMNQMDESLNDRLKTVFVTSQNKNTLMDSPKNRPLPTSRNSVTSVLPHSQEVETRTPNKLLVKEIHDILSNFKNNPDEWTVEHIAERYGIEPKKIELMLTHYGSFNSYLKSRPHETDKSLLHEEPEDRIRHDTSLYEMERILTKGRRKWLTLGEAIDRHFPPKDKK